MEEVITMSDSEMYNAGMILSEEYTEEGKRELAEEQKIVSLRHAGYKKNPQEVIEDYFNMSDLASKLWGINPYFFDKTGMFWLWDWDNRKWSIVDEVDVLNMIKKCSRHNTISSKSKNEILEAMKQYGRDKIPKPIQPSWVQFKDLIVDIRTGEEFLSTPEYFATNPIPYALHKNRFENTPIMDKIFEEWVGKENIKKLYEILAYCLITDYPIHRIFCFIGSGMNGKSKFLELLRKFIGSDNCCSTELDTLMQSRFEVTRLYKKLVCQMGETNFEELSKTSTLKKLSGGDLMGFEYKGKTPFEDINYAKIIISTNNLPTTTDKTIGFYRRWMIIDFPNTFSEKKDILKEIPEEEFESLALKSVIILRDLLQKREFHNEGTIEERMEKYEARSNFLEKFINTYLESDVDGFVTKSEFYRKFIDWCKDNRHRQMTETSLGMSMKKLNFEGSTKHFNWMNDGQGGNARVWVGLKWK
jgi:P4 family phage/plasmid primase-like protien